MSFIFDTAKEKMMAPGTLGTTSGDAIDLVDDNLKVSLVDTGAWNPTASSHEYFGDVGVATVHDDANNMTLPTVGSVGGAVFDAADETLTAVTGADCEAILIWKDTGTAATSPLIAIIDAGTGLPVTPNGGDIDIVWAAGGIFTL